MTSSRAALTELSVERVTSVMSALPCIEPEVWVCPASVPLTADEVAATLYAFSDLIDDYRTAP